MASCALLELTFLVLLPPPVADLFLCLFLSPSSSLTLLHLGFGLISVSELTESRWDFFRWRLGTFSPINISLNNLCLASQYKFWRWTTSGYFASKAVSGGIRSSHPTRWLNLATERIISNTSKGGRRTAAATFRLSMYGCCVKRYNWKIYRNW